MHPSRPICASRFTSSTHESLALPKPMTSFLTRNISPRAVVAVAAMTLLVSVGLGREKPEPPEVVALATSTPPQNVAADSAADLDLRQLERSRKADSIADLFAPRVQPAVVLPDTASAEPPAPPAPSAPPLPFTYLGKYIDGEKMEIFVAQGDEHYSVEKGKKIDGQYKVEKVTATAVTFIHLPSGTRQKLPIPAPK